MSNKFRSILFLTAAIWAIGVIWYVFNQFPSPDLRNIRLEQTFALTALVLLYFSIIFSRWLATKEFRSSLTAIAFAFGAVHGSVSFFFLLGGFPGLGFLSAKFILGISLSSTALLTLGTAAYLENLSRRFIRAKWVDGLLYLAIILITTHALLLGSHFIDLSALIPNIFFIALGVLLLLEAYRLDAFMAARFQMPKFSINLALAAAIVSGLGVYYFNPQTSLPSLGIHSSHMGMNMSSTGDSAKRYNVSFSTQPQNPVPGQDVTLRFKVLDADNGMIVDKYDIIFEKILHLVIVDSKLEYFNHIHPTFDGKEFVIQTKFPSADTYHLYLNFHPSGATEQQIGLSLQIGSVSASVPANTPNLNLKKDFDGLNVSLSAEDGGEFDSSLMSSASQVLNFHFTDHNNQPITDLEPYLGAFGHLVLINESNYQYIHVHPLASTNPNAGGPDVKFLPAALYTKITPGVYRVFGQFHRNGKVFVTDFTIDVK